MKNQVPHDKYFLRSLHQEIDLYDRKLAYLEKYVTFDSTADREEAEKKLVTKRASLAETAKKLAVIERLVTVWPAGWRGRLIPGSVFDRASLASRSYAIGHLGLLTGWNHEQTSQGEILPPL